MDFLTRKKTVMWTSPSGKVFEIKTTEGGHKRKHVGEVKTTPCKKKSTTKKIVDSQDTFSDAGVSGKSFSVKCIFIGDNHDIEAKEFEDGLCEVGKSKFRPAYGEEITVNVLDYDVKYSLLEKINATIITVNFHQTADTTYPNSAESNTKAVKNAGDITNAAIAQNMTDIVSNTSNVSLIESLNASFSNVLTKISTGLDTISNASLNSIIADIEGQVFTSNPFTIVSQLQKVVYKASNVVSKVKDITKNANSSSFGFLTKSFKYLINDIKSLLPKNTEHLTPAQINDLAIADTVITSIISAAAQSAPEQEFLTRKEAMDAAVSLIELDETRAEFISEQEAKIDDLKNKYICDSGISELVNMAASAIIEKSFNLKIEKTIILPEDEAVINLAYKYYKEDFEENPEETINYLITSNNFTDEEFFLIKRGTKLKIYV